MDEFIYQEMFPLYKDETDYRLLTTDYISQSLFEGQTVFKIDKDGLTLLAKEGFQDIAHYLRTSHLKLLNQIFYDPKSSDNEKFVALEMLKNAVISADKIFPMCQDTGTAVIIGKKGQYIWTNSCDKEALSKGVFDAYTKGNLRYSQNAPLNMYDEVNTRCNLPAQIDLYAVSGDEYNFLFIAKGGGSSNKTFLFQETKSLLNSCSLFDFLIAKMKTIGTSACPPYYLAFVIGGTSPELNLKTVKLAAAGYFDNLQTKGNSLGHAFRDIDLEDRLLQASRDFNIGAQFGGKYFCLSVRVIRLPRHGASCPIGLGVSCSAHRNIKAKITKQGIFLEKLETNPERFLPEPNIVKSQNSIQIDLNNSMDDIRADLSKYPVGTRLILNGKIIVARDIAHAKLKEQLDKEGYLPQYFKEHIIFYAGPAKTPEGFPSGALGPTTAGRMDLYVPEFQKNNASLVMLAKGNRTKNVLESCKKYGGFYLATIGGVAALFGKECITDMEVIAYKELGMEAVFMITVKNFPAFVIIDDKGNDFYK